ncbi:unnamed protein product [Effrenium voratum]|nr:unnamed protein product [Effrenium voratum]
MPSMPFEVVGAKTVVAVGSANPGKLTAVELALSRWAITADVKGFSVPSGVAELPIGHQETIDGANNRARNALEVADAQPSMGIGLESGFVQAGALWFDICACSVVMASGRNFTGLSSGLLLPPSVAATFQERGYNEAWEAALGRSADDKGDGVLGILSGGVLSRPKQMAESMDGAMLQLRNEVLYSRELGP